MGRDLIQIDVGMLLVGRIVDYLGVRRRWHIRVHFVPPGQQAQAK